MARVWHLNNGAQSFVNKHHSEKKKKTTHLQYSSQTSLTIPKIPSQPNLFLTNPRKNLHLNHPTNSASGTLLPLPLLPFPLFPLLFPPTPTPFPLATRPSSQPHKPPHPPSHFQTTRSASAVSVHPHCKLVRRGRRIRISSRCKKKQ
jgi:hypothetical protein